MVDEFILSNQNRILSFGEYVLEKLEDKDAMDKVAEKDPEKLARVLKLLLEWLDSAQPKAESPALAAIIRAVGKSGEEQSDEY